MKKTALILALALLCFAAGLYADKVINTTVVTVTIQDVLEVSIVREYDSEGVPTGDLLSRSNYQLRDDQGGIFDESRWIDIPLSAGQQTAVQDFVNSAVIPAINAAEGL